MPDEITNLLPINLTLYAEHGFDIKNLTELEKQENKLSYCANMSESLFRVIRNVLENDSDELIDDIINLSALGISISQTIADEVDDLERKFLKRPSIQKKQDVADNSSTNNVSM